MEHRFWRHFDFRLLGATVIAIGLGVAMIYSATLASLDSTGSFLDSFVVRQGLYASLGLGLLFLTAMFDYRFLEDLQRPLYLLMVALLVSVIVVGQVSGGAQRWLEFGPFPVQPAELAKIFVIITLAKYLADRTEKTLRFHHLVISLALVVVPMALIYLQPDLSTTVVLGVIWLAMVFMAGAQLWHILLLSGITGLATPWLWFQLKPYMRERIISFLQPEADPLEAGYNLNQARIAVGSGGWVGQGFASGAQSQLHFLRVRHTDFIFSVLAEELGFIGAILLFALFIFVTFRILRAGTIARDRFGRLITAGVAAVILFQSFVSIAVNMGLLPVTGMTLPFISYGGSSLVTLLVAVGLVESVVIRHRKLEFH